MMAVDAFGRARSAFFARQPQERWRGSYSSRRRQPQCRRGSADVLTINRPDARIEKSLATKKAEESETTWPCFNHRKDQATIRAIARSRRTAWETRCRS